MAEPWAGGGTAAARVLLAAAATNTTAADTPLGGPSSPVLDVIFCLAPVAFLLVVTLSQRLVSGAEMPRDARRCSAGAGWRHIGRTADRCPLSLNCRSSCPRPAACPTRRS